MNTNKTCAMCKHWGNDNVYRELIRRRLAINKDVRRYIMSECHNDMSTKFKKHQLEMQDACGWFEERK